MSYTTKGARFAPLLEGGEDRSYRKVLWRGWHPRVKDLTGTPIKKYVLFVGLNPSIADDVTDDMTIKKCVGFAKQWGYQGIYMLNLYSYIATVPQNLLDVIDPIGNPANDHLIGYYAERCGRVVACWGDLPARLSREIGLSNRVLAVRGLLGHNVVCLGHTQSGAPRHPSRIAYDTKLVPYKV